MDDIKALLLDLDGVVWKDTEPIGDLPGLFALMRENELRFMLTSNNATLSRESYVKKFAGFGVDISADRVVNSAIATAHHLKSRFPDGGPIYVVGEAGLRETLNEYGFYIDEQEPLAVVAGLDRDLNYEKLKIASFLIQGGVYFVGTNIDPTYPTPDGFVPGAGTVIKALETASGIEASKFGKPDPTMYQIALQTLGIRADESLVVGDRLTTDIAGGQILGCRTCLVLSGVTRKEKALEWDPPVDWIETDLTNVVHKLVG